MYIFLISIGSAKKKKKESRPDSASLVSLPATCCDLLRLQYNRRTAAKHRYSTQPLSPFLEPSKRRRSGAACLGVVPCMYVCHAPSRGAWMQNGVRRQASAAREGWKRWTTIKMFPTPPLTRAGWSKCPKIKRKAGTRTGTRDRDRDRDK